MSTDKKKVWLPLESNPELMNKYIYSAGVPTKYQFHELFCIDETGLGMIPQPVKAVLLCFPITDKSEALKQEQEDRIRKKKGNEEEKLSKVFYMKQLVGNACGTIGLIHSILNSGIEKELDSNKFFAKFLNKYLLKSPEDRGKGLIESDDIEEIHKDMAKQGDSKLPSIDEKVNLHFISFICIQDSLYELDGRKAFPIDHGYCSPNDLLQHAIDIIKKDFILPNPDQVQFNILAFSYSF